MSEAKPTFTIPDDLIKPAIEAHINGAILTALSGADKSLLIQRAIQHALSIKVDDQGKPSTYSSSRPWYEYEVERQLREGAREIIAGIVKGHAEAMKKALVTELTRKGSPLLKQFAESMVEGAVKAASNSWRVELTLKT